METKVNTVKDARMGAFIDHECTIMAEGKSFSAGGAWLCQHSETGKWAGIVYGHPAEHHGEFDMVTNWDGTIAIACHFGRVFRGNMGDKCRYVRFTYYGHTLTGLWAGIDFNQSIRVRER